MGGGGRGCGRGRVRGGMEDAGGGERVRKGGDGERVQKGGRGGEMVQEGNITHPLNHHVRVVQQRHRPLHRLPEHGHRSVGFQS